VRKRLAIAVTLLVLAVPGAALGNGDPASDVLLQAKVYFPTQRVSVAEATKLKNIVQSANAKGYTIRVALIHDEADLGTVPNLLNQPQKYAEFLGPEIRFVYKGDLLVVMPTGLGLTSTDETPPPAAKTLSGMLVEAGGSPDGLAQTAEEAVTKLAAAAGHPLVAQKKSGGGGGGAIAGIVVAVLLLAAGIGGAFWVRRNQPTTPEPGDDGPAAP
jgi:hypothetical protein